VYIQTREPNDFDDILTRINFLDLNFSIQEKHFERFPTGSFVFLDDFTFTSMKKQEKIDFLTVTNYFLRHHKISLFLIVHNLYGNNLFTDILTAPHIFLAYSSLGFTILR
jgi:hypothetical protein